MASESTSESVTVVISDIKSDESLLLLVERLLNRSNLQCDSYLVSKLKEDMTIPLDVLALAPSLSTFREPPVSNSELIERLKDVLGRSTQVSLTADKSSVKLSFSIQRHTVIIRDIPSTVSPDEIRNLLPETFQSKISNVQSEVGNNWFVTFETEADAHEALSLIRKTKYNGKMIGARLKAESLLRGTPAVRSGPRPATSAPAVATPPADAPVAAPAAPFTQPHAGFPAAPTAAKPPTPGFSSFYQPGYYGSTNWYYPQGTHQQPGAVHSHDSLINTPVHSFPSSLTPASIPSSAPIPTYPATYQPHAVPHSAQPFDGTQKMAPLTSPRTKPSPSSGSSFSGRAKPNSQSGQPNSQNRNKSTHTSSSNPSGKRRPRADNPSGSHKPADPAQQSTGHPSTTNKKRGHLQRGARADDASGPRSVESHHHHAPKPVSLTARNFPPLSSGPSVSPTPASAWTKEGLNNVKTPTAKPPKVVVAVVPEPSQPSTPEQTPAPQPIAAPAPVPVVAAPPSQPVAAPAPIQQTPIQAPPSQATSSPAPTSQTFSKPNWASIAARAPGQH